MTNNYFNRIIEKTEPKIKVLFINGLALISLYSAISEHDNSNGNHHVVEHQDSYPVREFFPNSLVSYDGTSIRGIERLQ